jgi:hypothetical protein
MEYIIALNAALALAEKLLPIIESQVAKGQITPSQQQIIRDQYMALRAKADAAFQGQEWDVTP